MTMHEPPPDYERLLAVAERERAPLTLRERVEADRSRLATRAAISRRLRLSGVLAGAAAVVGVVVGLAVPGDGGPTVLEAAGLGVKPALAAAPPVHKSRPDTLEASVGGVDFPAWGTDERWTASGRRSDELDGRKTETVFYDSSRGSRLGYTIVDGDPLPWPENAKTVTRRGVAVHLLRHDGRLIAVWRVHDRTCVISAPATVSESRLVRLASIATYT
ncbi:MAG TPA: hypothetical protein VFB41_05670 [Solirubrobacteraceae bacterium]|nr:hypothetical protein [Solirubrobacteraceae bacterium]